MTVAGFLRVSKDKTIYEIPYAGGKGAMKMEGKIPSASKEALAEIVKGFKGKISYEPDGVKIEVPKDAHGVWDEISDLFKLDKKIRSIFDIKKHVKYADEVTGALKTPKDREAEADKTRAEKGVTWESEEAKQKAEEKAGKTKEKPKKNQAPGKGFRVEVPVNMPGLIKRLRNNKHIKSVIDNYNGEALKGEDGIVLEFPDRRKREDILDEIADAIRSSGFLTDVLDAEEATEA